MSDEGELWIPPSSIALPVWIVGDIACGDGDGINEGERIVGSGGWIAELRVEGDTVGAGWVDGKEAADYFPDTGGLECVFLSQAGQYVFCCGGMMREGLSWRKKGRHAYLVDGNDSLHGLRSFRYAG